METIKKNRIILITGCNRGLGFSLSQKLLTESFTYTVIITARTNEKTALTVKKILQENPKSEARILSHSLDINKQDSR